MAPTIKYFGKNTTNKVDAVALFVVIGFTPGLQKEKPMTQTLVLRTDQRGLLAQFSNGTANTTAYLANELRTLPGFDDLISGLEPFSNGIEQNSKSFIGDEANKRNFKLWENIVKKPMQDALVGMATAKVETEDRLKQYGTPPVAGETEALIRSETRELIRSMKPGDLAATLPKADYRTLAAIAESPSLNTGLSNDLYEMAVERFRLLNLIQKLGLYAEHKNKPTLDKLVATGVNQDSVEAEGRAILVAMKKKLENIELAEGTLRHLISLSGMLTGKTDQDILNALA